MNDKYCPRSKIKKLKMELRMFPEESDEVEKYVGRLPDMIQGSKQNVAKAYSVGSSKNKEYVGNLPLWNKCKFHHNGPCTVKCANYKRVGHLTQDCRSLAVTNNQRTLTCYECGYQGHYRSDCQMLNNQNYGNQMGGIEARGMVYALGGGETNQDLDNMEDDINA
ncbi:reverse transcriptase domain-containing protein [Tanacetum coccineum]